MIFLGGSLVNSLMMILFSFAIQFLKKFIVSVLFDRMEPSEIPFQIMIDEALDVAVHDRLDIDFGIFAAMVLDQGIRAEDIRTDLAGEGDILLDTADFILLFLPFLFFELEELGLEHLHAEFLVGKLVSFNLA